MKTDEVCSSDDICPTIAEGKDFAVLSSAHTPEEEKITPTTQTQPHALFHTPRDTEHRNSRYLPRPSQTPANSSALPSRAHRFPLQPRESSFTDTLTVPGWRFLFARSRPASDARRAGACVRVPSPFLPTNAPSKAGPAGIKPTHPRNRSGKAAAQHPMAIGEPSSAAAPLSAARARR